MLAQHCYEIWLELLNQADMAIKKKMFEWFTGHLDGSVIDYMEDYIEKVLMEGFQEEDFVSYKLSFTDQKVREADAKADSWTQKYQVDKWALWHLDLMKKTGGTRNELEDYGKRHWISSGVRKYFIEEYITKNDYDTAIDLLKESQQLDAEYSGLVREYSLKLKALYLQLGKTEEYKAQLWSLIQKDYPGDVAVYRELKALYPKEEWLEMREKVYSSLRSYANVDKLYLEEKAI